MPPSAFYIRHRADSAPWAPPTCPSRFHLGQLHTILNRPLGILSVTGIFMKYGTIIAAVYLLATPVFGHHSDAALNMESVVTFEGAVTEYSLRNPHAYFTVNAINESGEQVEWTVQMASAHTMRRLGWTPDSLSIGDQVIVGVNPARDGRFY